MANKNQVQEEFSWVTGRGTFPREMCDVGFDH